MTVTNQAVSVTLNVTNSGLRASETHLGRPTRFLNMLRVFKPQSAMTMGAWTLVGFSVVQRLLLSRRF
jgi:hypothetical protein